MFHFRTLEGVNFIDVKGKKTLKSNMKLIRNIKMTKLLINILGRSLNKTKSLWNLMANYMYGMSMIILYVMKMTALYYVNMIDTQDIMALHILREMFILYNLGSC